MILELLGTRAHNWALNGRYTTQYSHNVWLILPDITIMDSNKSITDLYNMQADWNDVQADWYKVFTDTYEALLDSTKYVLICMKYLLTCLKCLLTRMTHIPSCTTYILIHKQELGLMIFIHLQVGS